MKVLGIMGSPRIKGNTDILLEQALNGAKDCGAEIEKIVIDRLNIQPCREYYGCLRDGKCVIRDDMDQIYPKLTSSDVVIMASPMFFYGITAQMKALIDRCQALWSKKYHLKQQIGPEGRKCAFIGVGATRGKQLFDGSLLVIKYFSQAIDAKYAGELLVRGIDQKGDIKSHEDILQQAYDFGAKLVHQ